MSQDNVEGSAATAPAAPGEPNHLLRAIIIWAVLSVIGIVISIVILPFILPATTTSIGAADDLTFVVLTVLAVPVALWVFVFLVYSLIVFRVSGRATEDAPVLKPYPNLQIGFLGITSGLCLFLLIWGLTGFYQESVAAAPNPIIVQVTGQQWMWTFTFPQYGVSSQGQVLELPVNRAVEFSVTSKDVLHGFAIQEFGMRVDANPGEITTLPAVIPTQVGTYAVRCVELCGLYHSYMWEAVNVVSSQTFDSWIISQGGHP